jgi:D-alanyl-D-alanine carboxypeptidase/D-alanyl-D-alanine-endopeptidase (penicillin-binding protein 4)
VAALLLAAALAPDAHALDAAGLRAGLASRAAPLGPASGVLVTDLADERALFELRSTVPRVPASNEKLFTTAASLLRFGPQARFETSARIPSAAEVGVGGVLRGDLFLVGGGDPSLGDAALGRLADQVRATGLRRVTGGVRGDESWFDARRGGPRTGFAADRDMGGWLGALTWGHGQAYPGGPAVVAAARFQRLLTARGVRFGAAARAGTLPDRPGTELGAVRSPAVRELIRTTNVGSDNFYAETLAKQLGASFGTAGTTTAGLGIVREELGRLRVRPVLADGSGLSRANRTSPATVVQLLARMDGQEVAASWHASLAVMGRSGTLRGRLRGTAAQGRCWGKTGTINAVSALSGYCRRPDGELTAFSILANGVSTSSAKRAEDRIVALIAQLR